MKPDLKSNKTIKGLVLLMLILGMTGCAGQSDPKGNSLAGIEAFIFVGNSADGTVSVIEHGDEGNTVIESIPVGTGSVGDIMVSEEGHVFVNVTDDNTVATIDPVDTATPEFVNFIPVGNRPVHGYTDPTDGTKLWVMNDGDANTAPCLTAGPGGTVASSVTVIQNHETGGGDIGEVLATVCVGRGHHKAAFSDNPMRVFVSNITDGTITVIDNDPASGSFLEAVDTIDLGAGAVPHGIDYSPVSGKIYNANVGHGTVVVIDPATGVIESTLNVGFSNKLHASPDGAFIVTKGTDTGSDPDHVIGKLTVIDVSDNSFSTVDIQDVHPDSFEFTPDGEKLYVTSATSGSGAQQANIKNDVLLVYDASSLPGLPLLSEVTVGVSDEDHRAIAIHNIEDVPEHVFVPNPADGNVSVVHAETDMVMGSVDIGGEPSSILVYPVEGAGHTHGG